MFHSSKKWVFSFLAMLVIMLFVLGALTIVVIRFFIIISRSNHWHIRLIMNVIRMTAF